ncbi:unnamed protein product [Parascedosporium putredinis]|uniref:Enoyl-CoA hydratase n=1 Tax=Parascedosporium putredinis TaxID=1442378 RepID=A0A9P1H140_9PEZI|nr:unnamed protein product [Parascedosporium putredinis]CAI7993297.1 unnamed protein product [Parascedosporium putredinis]
MDKDADSVVSQSTPQGITTITINRPHRRNAVNPATAQKLYDAIIAFEDDPTQKVGILAGAGGTFAPVPTFTRFLKPMPIGGLELSLLGDMRVVEEDAVFGVFCRRWGVPLIDGGTVRLRAIVGLGHALDMILTGRPGKALGEATAIAKQLLEFPQLCMNLDRNSCYYGAYEASSFQDALANEFDKGCAAVEAESIRGAARFSSGAGRGTFENREKL